MDGLIESEGERKKLKTQARYSERKIHLRELKSSVIKHPKMKEFVLGLS